MTGLSLARNAGPTPQVQRAAGVLGYLSEPEDSASVVFFRIALGAIVLLQVLSFAFDGKVGDLYVKPLVHFTYLGFDWIRPLPPTLMYLHFVLVAVLALCVMLGLWYRVTSVIFFLAWTYVFLVQRAYFHSPFYLIATLAFLMIFASAHWTFSIDVLRHPRIRSEQSPRWVLWLLRLQVGVVYFYGGVCKLNADWLQGAPMRQVLAGRAETPLVGSLLSQEWTVQVFTFGGLFLDLFIVPLLLWRRTRLFAFALAVAFHLANALLWDVGVFPWVTIAATTLFLAPDWPRQIYRFVMGSSRRRRNAASEAAMPWRTLRFWQLALIGIYAAVQIVVPLQPFLYAGNVSWTGEGERFSWQLKVKRKDTQPMSFYLTDPVRGETTKVRLDHHLMPWQIGRMSFQPDMILQFAHYLRKHSLETEGVAAEVRAHGKTSVNARMPQMLVDPTVNLAAVPRTLAPADWIIPLTEPLPSAEDQRNSKFKEGFGEKRIVFATGPTVTDDQIAENLPRLLADSNLDALHLCHSRVTDEGLRQLSGLQQLVVLDLFGTSISDKGLARLHEMQNLAVLNVGETKVTDAGVEALRAALPNLRITR